jgi:hypothetical protein
MRALILGFSALAIVASTNVARAGLSTAPRQVASIDTATVPDKPDKPDHQDHRRGGGRAHHARGVGGPIGFIGGALGGMFRR